MQEKIINHNKPWFYKIIFAFYDVVSLAFMALFIYWTYVAIKWASADFTNWSTKVIAIIVIDVLTLILSCLVIFYSVRTFFDSVIGIFLYKYHRHSLKKMSDAGKNAMNKFSPRVAIVIPVFNDFTYNSTLDSFHQTYKNCLFYLLDDSDDEKVIKEVDEFAIKHNVTVLRGHNKKVNGKVYNCGLAAAFANFVTKTNKDWDFFVHVDSGDVLNPRHVEEVVPLFYANKKLGIVTPCSTNVYTRSPFQNLVSSYEEITGVSGVFQSFYVTRIMPGAGTTYRKEALMGINGMWPDCLSEDGAVSLSLIKKGWKSMFSNINLSQQLDPYDYNAFVKRMWRWDKGLYQMYKQGYYNPKNYPELDFSSRSNLFFTGINSILRMPYMLYILILYPLICWSLQINMMFFPYISLMAFSLQMFVTGLIFFGFSVIKKGFKESLHYLGFSFFFIFIYGGCFFKALSCWATSFLLSNKGQKKKTKFIITKKNMNTDFSKVFKNCRLYVISFLIIVSTSLALYFTLVHGTSMDETTKFLWLIPIPNFFMLFLFIEISSLSFIVLEIFSNTVKSKKNINNRHDFSSVLLKTEEFTYDGITIKN